MEEKQRDLTACATLLILDGNSVVTLAIVVVVVCRRGSTTNISETVACPPSLSLPPRSPVQGSHRAAPQHHRHLIVSPRES